MAGRRTPFRTRDAADDGFTLVEVIVAMGVAAVILTALLAATISAAQASVGARIDQQAGDLLTKSIEDIRSLDYGAVAMQTSDLAGDATITGAPPVWTVPNGVGVEPIVANATGSVSPHITTVTANTNKVPITLRRYVTQPTGENTKRVTVIVQWTFNGQARSRTASTIVANTRRGLPLPSFVVSYSGGGTQTANPGGYLEIPIIIKNLGARDSFQMRVMAGASAQSGWDFFPDVTCAGGLDPDAMPTALSLSGGVPVTGDLLPDSTTCFIARKSASTLGTTVVTVTGTSTRQPTASTAVSTSANVTLVVQTGIVSPTPTPTSSSPTPTPTSSSATPAPSTTSICANPDQDVTVPTGFTKRRFILQNSPTGDTTTQATNPMQKDDCTVQLQSHNYSTESGAGVGRLITTGGTIASGGSASVGEWRWLAPALTEIQGAAVVRFAYQCNSGSSTAQVALGDWNQTKNNNQWTQRATASQTLSCNGAWRTAEVQLTVPNFILRSKTGANATPTNLDLRMAVTSGSQLRVNFDSADAPSALFVGTKP